MGNKSSQQSSHHFSWTPVIVASYYLILRETPRLALWLRTDQAWVQEMGNSSSRYCTATSPSLILVLVFKIFQMEINSWEMNGSSLWRFLTISGWKEFQFHSNCRGINLTSEISLLKCYDAFFICIKPKARFYWEVRSSDKAFAALSAYT